MASVLWSSTVFRILLALHLAQDRHRLLGAHPPPAAPRRAAAEAAAEAARTGPLKFEEGT
jgi:hypothetical protein